LNNKLQFKTRPNLFFAGQITGIEGYAGNIASGLVAGINAANVIMHHPLIELPKTTMIGALCYYIANASPKDFQPMKANFGILPPLEGVRIRGKRKRREAYSQRALREIDKISEQLRIGIS